MSDYRIETKCIQSVMSQETENLECFRSTRARHLSIVPVNRWDVCLTWRNPAILYQIAKINERCSRSKIFDVRKAEWLLC